MKKTKTLYILAVVLLSLYPLFGQQQAYEVYMLFSPLRSKNSNLVDLYKNIAKTWASEYGAVNAAYLLEDASVTLKWNILSQSNNFGFEVERFIKSKWGKIGFVKGNGTSAKPITYQFIDKIKKNENNISSIQYRIKQIDNDGSFVYSDVTTVQITKPVKISLFQNYPNPFNSSTTISFSLPAANKVSLKIYDMRGKQVAELVDGRLNAGTHTVQWQAENLPSGIYYSILKSGSYSETRRMVLMK